MAFYQFSGRALSCWPHHMALSLSTSHMMQMLIFSATQCTSAYPPRLAPRNSGRSHLQMSDNSHCNILLRLWGRANGLKRPVNVLVGKEAWILLSGGENDSCQMCVCRDPFFSLMFVKLRAEICEGRKGSV